MDLALNNTLKAALIWESILPRQIEGKTVDSKTLFYELIQLYGTSCFQTEIINAVQAAQAEFFVAPYQTAPQMVYFYREKVVNICAGSVQCLLYSDQPVDQVIVNIDERTGIFEFVDQADLRGYFNKASLDVIQELFLHGGIYNKFGLILENPEFKPRNLFKMLNPKTLTEENIEKLKKEKYHQNIKILELINMIKLVPKVCPILNIKCQLDCLFKDKFEGFKNNNFEKIMGLCFNNSIYY